MFEPIAQDKWLTAQQVFSRLNEISDKTITYERVVQILRDLRNDHAHTTPTPFKKIGRSWLYHPDFVQAAASRETTPGVKSQNPNKKRTE